MKIYDEHGAQVGEIEKPEPVKQDGVWFEPVEYRIPIVGDFILNSNGDIIPATIDFCHVEFWIMRPIPRATLKQLKAIGMKERDGRPVEVKDGNKVWDIEDSSHLPCRELIPGCEECRKLIGKHRWVLVPVEKDQQYGCLSKDCPWSECQFRDQKSCSRYEPPVAKEAILHTDCRLCSREKCQWGNSHKDVDHCINFTPKIKSARKEPAPIGKTVEGELCPKCGSPFAMTPICIHCGSIPVLGDGRQPAPEQYEPRYTWKEFTQWLNVLKGKHLDDMSFVDKVSCVQIMVNDLQDGIEKVMGRKVLSAI